MENNFKSSGKWLITVDLDGTFLLSPGTKIHTPNSDIHPKNIEVIKRLVQLGHKFAIVTGRPWKDAKQVYESIGLKSIIANYNGAHIHFPGNEDDFTTLTYSINKDILQKVLQEPILQGKTSSVLIETLDATYSTDSTTDLAAAITHDRDVNVVQWKIGEDFNGAPLSSLVGIDLSKCENPDEILQVLNRKYGAALFFRYWDYRDADNPWLMLEINQKTSNKGSAMKHIAQYYNIPLSRTITFGDGLNDREMLIDAAIGVAMKNAKGTVKTYADDTTNFTNDEAGVGMYLEEFFDLK